MGAGGSSALGAVQPLALSLPSCLALLGLHFFVFFAQGSEIAEIVGRWRPWPCWEPGSCLGRARGGCRGGAGIPRAQIPWEFPTSPLLLQATKAKGMNLQAPRLLRGGFEGFGDMPRALCKLSASPQVTTAPSWASTEPAGTGWATTARRWRKEKPAPTPSPSRAARCGGKPAPAPTARTAREGKVGSQEWGGVRL